MSFLRRAASMAALLCGLALLGGGVLLADERASDAKTVEVPAKDITLEVPKAWKRQQPKSKFRLVQFQVPAPNGKSEPAEMVVYWFPNAGGVDANLDRWVKQFQPKGRKVTLTQGTSEHGPYWFADIEGTYNQPVGPPVLRKTKPLPDARMLGIILPIEGKGEYYIKLPGPKAAVSPWTDALRKAIGGSAKSEKPYEPKKGT